MRSNQTTRRHRAPRAPLSEEFKRALKGWGRGRRRPRTVLCTFAGIDQFQISRFMRGATAPFMEPRLLVMAAALGLDPRHAFDESGLVQ